VKLVKAILPERSVRFRLIGIVLLALLGATLGACGRGAERGGVEDVLKEGWRAYSTGDFDFAIQKFESVGEAPGATPEQHFSALLGLATSYHLRSNPDFEQARLWYERLGELKTGDAQRQSLLGLGRVDLAEGKSGAGQTNLVRLIQDFPDSVEANEAVVHVADSLFKPTGKDSEPGQFSLAGGAAVERGLNMLEERLRAYPHNTLATTMHLMLAGKYIELQQFEKAVGHLLAAEEEGIAGVMLQSVTLWRIARIADLELKDYDLAERYYAKYAEEFPRTTLYYRATKSLERVRALKKEGGA